METFKTVHTAIIPVKPEFAKTNGPNGLNLEAICVFAAIGFFLDTDTYWKNQKVLSPASTHVFDSDGYLVSSSPWFKWHYSPRAISFEQALDEFTALFETIVKEQVQGKKVILPLSGGIDSRTQAVALYHLNANVFSYSYAYEHGYNETRIAGQIADACGFDFRAFFIPKGYLWECIDDLAKCNGCYSEFTNPRQMAIQSEFERMGDVFSLGHWGDVLFDSMNLPPLTDDEQVGILVKKLLKRGGLQLASRLWTAWNLAGDFETYFIERIRTLLKPIAIADTKARLRAFKSLYWAPRWTSVNLSIFESVKPITLPYYDDRMCEFICRIPEAYLSNRALQIAYIKKRSPKLASIVWQDQRPFNLNTYRYNKGPWNLPYKLTDKAKRKLNATFGRAYVQRNWELQFLGNENQKHLLNELLHSGLEQWIPKSFILDQYDSFKNSPLSYAHSINMLLVFSKFNQHYIHG